MRPELTALLIAPDRTLAAQFTASQSGVHTFQILAELKSYPSQRTLDIRLKQLHPDLVILDAGTDLQAACEAIKFISSTGQAAQVVCLHPRNDSEALLTCLRLGACEFLFAPFDAETQREAVLRLLRLRQTESAAATQSGPVIVYASAKPGSGASTLAFHTACLLQQTTRQKVLLIDLDLTNGTIGFHSKLNHPYSVLDALDRAHGLSGADWNVLVASRASVDILQAPAIPYCGAVDAGRLSALFDSARTRYDYVLVDAPVIFRRLSLIAVSNSDRALLVSTGEIGSVHLTRKAVHLLDQLGFPKERFQILLNRVNRNDEVGRSGLEKLFSCQVSARVPEDAMGLHRVLTMGGTLDSESALGKEIGRLAGGLVHASPAVTGPSLRPRVQ